ncbi:MAG TPA: diguanylate cyclase response regulator [Thermodesulfobacteriota bacterium]
MRLLLVGSTPDDAARFEAGLARASPAPVEVRPAGGLADAARHLAEGRVDAMVIDAVRPEGRDLEALRRTCRDWPHLPVVVLTAAGDDAFGLKAIEAGAQDALPKPDTTPPLLARAVAYAVERQRLLCEIRALALVDELTGLYNRRGFFTLAGHELRVAARQRRRVFLLFADLDGMKWINDSLGHAAGDRALIEAAEVLKATFRESDTIARLGGDEFAVFALSSGRRAARDRPAERLRRALAERTRRPGRPFPLAMSIGVVERVPDATTTIDQLLAIADERMYRDKRARGAGRPRAG